MVRYALTAALATAALAGSALAQDLKGSREKKCPADSPCCGLYGDCGVGAFCLGGCDVTMSHSFKSCVPNPICKSGKYSLDSLDDIQSIDKYLGDNSKVNWQSQGTPTKYNDALLLTMAEGTVGTLLASTFYVWYGKICAKMTTSQGKGVVTAFIMMSDVKDEIDFEFVGTDINNAQSNWYSQGVTDYTNSKNLTVQPDTVGKVHEYCIDWTPDELKWIVDGNTARSVKKSDTFNKTADRFEYPQTPSRIMLSLWPAGLPSNAKGTIDWAGGEIDWNSKYMRNGYYYAMVQEVTVECYDPPANTKKNGKKSYKYTDEAVTQEAVELSDDFVILGSLEGTGENPGEASKSSSSGPRPTKSAAQVPGGNPGGGNRQETTTADAPSSSNTGGSSNSGGGTDFVQNNNPSGGVALEPVFAKIGGSALAIVVAILGLLVL
jgi:beta-glucanase (GH16 family)